MLFLRLGCVYRCMALAQSKKSYALKFEETHSVIFSALLTPFFQSVHRKVSAESS